MKTAKFYFNLLLCVALSMACFSCSDDDDDKGQEPGKDVPQPFNVWVSIGSTSGMGSENTQLVQGVKNLEEQGTIDFKGAGVDVTAKLYQESIIHGHYYYQIPKEKDRFGKYMILDDGIVTVAEIPFKTNTYKDRRYTHAFIDDNTFVVMAANGDATKVIWTKINAADMTILSEGELSFPDSAPAVVQFSTSGIASYRKNDNKILYSYLDNKNKKRFYMAFINPSDMKVEKVVTEDRAEMMAGTAYGELLQDKSFFDANGDYYLACNSVISGAPSTTQQYGAIVRIKKGETDFDKSYLGYRNASGQKGKLITMESLASGKALLYIMDPEHTGAAGWGSDYNCYYAILDLTTDKLTELDLPYNEGNFSQRSVVKDNKAYIGVNPKSSSPCIYIYDIASGKLTKGLTITEGYSFDRIVALD